jgi:signal transduction histidine kinase
MRKLTTLAVVATVTLVGLAPPFGGVARAQESRGGGAVSAQMVAEMQQLGSENTSLKAENAQLKQQLAAAQKERDDLKKGQQSTESKMRSSQAALARSTAADTSDQQKIAAMQASTQQLIAKFRELVETLRKTEVDDATNKQTLAMRQQDLKVCTDRNQALYKLDDDVLTHFEKQGFLTRLASDEPFTRIERVRLENYADETRGRAQEQLYLKPAGTVPPQ